ncbi:MAG: UDP-N-acetylenolpyruvoylglucosamine reductase [Candidatus Staskawiczbacteria bacterium RIFCSPLOWO2_01_FULL_38_12b]|uniref:UDP-N-acetylenolpyruvoylglucosamine reductase n=1 Tax=Candidatus Staskawiczbacteria bacterium RIFCSPLOWO2_01_FULL_38_12b TaxID=1802214 RepID=A0A1G2ICH7_9BACT|nr:MAG: UDP-N-acetylenolpyruvoylglucosamine reductase [Candidatus Staskawiczbacteria bacterium RIFCSPLOWO2_01_FULL_38_12b]
MDATFTLLQKALPGLQKNILLKNYTSFKIGGPAEYFLVTHNKNTIIKAIALAKKIQIPVFVLGGGTNLLVSDKGVKGLVVKIENHHPIAQKNNSCIEAGAGVLMKSLVSFSVEKSLQGLEWAGGLPGTFGGAIRGNAGAFGGETQDSILEVEALDEHLQVKKLNNKRCQFSYRNSVFKEKKWIVLSAKLQLKKGDKKELGRLAASHIAYRKQKHPLEYPSAGSVFKNVDFKKIPARFQTVFLDKVKKDPFEIVPAAWFIIGAGLTGKKIGRAEVSKKHSNYIINLGGAKATDVLKLIALVKKQIKKKYGIVLEQEVQFLK